VIAVRPYAAKDRDRVREIAFATGFMGEPADWYWRDARSFADVWTAWYTDHEPESAFIAEEEGAVVGYLTGCLDSRRAPSPRAEILRQLVRRQLLLRPGTAGFFWRSILDTLRQRDLPSGELSDPRWPSHLHTNLLPEARGRGAGRRLMQAWLARLRERRSPGCHLGTLAENRNAIAFFTHMGFAPYGPPLPVPGMRLRGGGRMHQQLMVLDTPSGPAASRAGRLSGEPHREILTTGGIA
jgi:ribosomal protein S18 acetylase RimI-like enzyme